MFTIVTRRKTGFTLQCFLPVLIVIVAVGAVYAYNSVVWSNDDLKAWKDYNHARSVISDYPMPSYSNISSKLNDLGVSKNDYTMLGSWMTGDMTVFNQATVSGVADLADYGSIDALIKGIPSATQAYISTRLDSPKLLYLILLVCVCVAFQKNRTRAVLPLILGLIAAILLTDMGRLPQRVEYPIWAFAFGMSALLAQNDEMRAGIRRGAHENAHQGVRRNTHEDICGGTHKNVRRSMHGDPRESAYENMREGIRKSTLGSVQAKLPKLVSASSATLAALAVIFICWANIPYFSLYEVKMTFQQESYVPSDNYTMIPYVKSHPENVYVYDVFAYTNQIENAYEKKYIPSDEFLNHNITCGGWGSGSSYRNALLQNMGTDSTFKALYEKNNFYFVSEQKDECKYIEIFLKEHYGIHTKAVVVDEPSEGLYILSFHPKSK